MKKLFLIIALALANIYVNAQTTLTGKVTDESGAALFGVSIYEKGTTNGTFSGGNGQYSLRYGNSNSIIVFSYIGFAAQEIKVDGKTTLDVTLKQAADLKAVEIVGSRRLNRTSTETPVAVDMIDVARFTSTSGTVDVNQLLQFVAPSFNSNKQSGADGADHVDPATLRGLGPDQTLVLINGKRRHQSSLINIFGTRGRGNTGTDLNAIPASAIDHIEILRDGAAAQYGSDAIAGVINIVLKSNVDEFTGNFMSGMYNAKPPSEYKVLRNDNYDGQTYDANANYGVKLGETGFANFTLDYQKKDHTNRPSDPAAYDVYRNQYGDAAAENFGFYLNSQFKSGEHSEVYAFGGYNYRFTDAYAWTRTADEDRNVISIYPNGFDPKIQSIITDKSISAGIKSKLNKWNMDINNTYGSNRFNYAVDNTLNASMLDKSPTYFNAGGFSLGQNTTGINITRLFDKVLKGFNLSMGTEVRIETYKIFAGEEGSYKNYGGYFVFDVIDSLGNIIGQDSSLRPAGSQGFPGFQPSNELNQSRTNFSLYVDGELDVTKHLTIDAALRFETYSDFGNTTNGKIAARYAITKWLSVRAAYSTGFRAPSLAQLYFNTTYTDFVAGQPIDKIIAENNSPITRALGIPELKQEKSTNICGGLTANYKAFSLTADVYHVKIDDRIVLTGSFYNDDPDIGADLQTLNVGAAQFFTNAVNTSTTGLDIVAAYSIVLKNYHTLRFSVAGNFNMMEIDNIYTNDKLAGKENTYFGLREQYFLLASAPKNKENFSVEYAFKGLFANFRFTQFGQVELINFNDNGDNVVDQNELDVYKPVSTIDLAAGYKFKNFTITLGGNNLTNKYPDAHDPAVTESGGIWDAVQMGFSGTFYYAKVGFKF